MKKIAKSMLLPFCLLGFLLSGCGIPDGDFWGTEARIVAKQQTTDDKEKKQAKYYIRFSKNNYATMILIMPENFGEVGDVVHAENRTLKATPMLEDNR